MHNAQCQRANYKIFDRRTGLNSIVIGQLPGAAEDSLRY